MYDHSKKEFLDKTEEDKIRTIKGLDSINDILEDISPFMYYSLLEENETLKRQIEHKDKIVIKLEELYLEQLKSNL